MKEDASMERTLSLQPPIPSTRDASGKSIERRFSSNTKMSVCATTEPELEAETSVMFEIGRKMIRLYLCDDHFCEECLNHFRYIESKGSQNTENVTEKLLQNGFMELVQEILRQFLRKAVAASSAWLPVIRSTCNTIIDMTDHSSAACRKVIQLELHVDFINLLKSDHLDTRRTDQDLSFTLFDLVDGAMTVLYNVVQVTTEARELFREEGIIEVIQRFRTGTTKSLSCLTIMFQAWVINDEENSILNSTDKVFGFLNNELSFSLDSVSHRSADGYKAVEILAAINKLIVNDANKDRFVKSGVLSSYTKFLEPLMDEDEQFLAAQGLWTLAFKCAEEMKKEEFCIERLELLLKKSENDGVRRQVNGVLIALGVKEESPIQPSKLSSNKEISMETGEKRKRIFISYQHSSTESVVRIRDRLRCHGYIVWMDADNVRGSIAEEIAHGIDTSSVVLACLSQKYYESPYCKKEIIYGDENQKEIIPLIMEPKYQPHGWLSFRIADKLRIDFSQPQSFEASLRILLQKLKKSFAQDDFNRTANEEGNGISNSQSEVSTPSSHVPTVDPEVNDSGATCEQETVVMETSSTSYSVTTTAGVFSWTKADVREWLERNNLQHLIKWFDDYDGRLLLEFQYQLEKYPQFVVPSFIADNSVKDFLRLVIALRTLPLC